ncbi:MAG: endonuclease III [Candidatus Brockarchaeota archaeon]|nr:endonuclease III [Candidatus Brockarchaeota archaeon]
MSEKRRAKEILELLSREYPGSKVALNFTNPLELLIATILSARCTDAKVNQVTAELFKKYKTPEQYAKADLGELRRLVRPLGSYRRKAKFVKECCKALVKEFNSRVPDTMEGLLSLPGVARKTANIVLSNAYGIVEGIAVDTHVARLSRRLGLTESRTPDKIEQDLMKVVPKEDWFKINYLLIDHGRKTCKALKPLCTRCVLKEVCPSAFKV